MRTEGGWYTRIQAAASHRLGPSWNKRGWRPGRVFAPFLWFLLPHDVIGTSLLCLPNTLGWTLWNVTKWLFPPLSCQSCGHSYLRGMTSIWYFYMYTPECDLAFVLCVFLLYQPFLSFSWFHLCVCESVHVRMCDDQTTLWECVLTLLLKGPSSQPSEGVNLLYWRPS